MPPIKEDTFICTVEVDVFITELYIFPASHSAAKSYKLKDKLSYEKEWTLTPKKLTSMSKSSPFPLGFLL